MSIVAVRSHAVSATLKDRSTAERASGDALANETLSNVLSGTDAYTKEGLLRHYLNKSAEYSRRADEIKRSYKKYSNAKSAPGNAVRKGQVASYLRMADEMENPVSGALFGMSPETQAKLCEHFRGRYRECLKPAANGTERRKAAPAKGYLPVEYFEMRGREGPYRDAVEKIGKLLSAELGFDSLREVVRHREFG